MGWAEELTEENFYAIYDVALDIRADFQLGQPPSIPMVPSLIKFSILMPADGINMRDRYGNLRWKAMQFLEKKAQYTVLTFSSMAIAGKQEWR